MLQKMRQPARRLGAHPRATSSRNRALLAADTALTNHWPARRAAGVTALRPPSQQLASYYNESRIHRSLDKDAPCRRAIERFGVITSQEQITPTGSMAGPAPFRFRLRSSGVRSSTVSGSAAEDTCTGAIPPSGS